MKTNFFILAVFTLFISLTSISFSKTPIKAEIKIDRHYVPGERELIPKHGGPNSIIVCLPNLTRICYLITNIHIDKLQLPNKALFFPDTNEGSVSIKEGSKGAYYDENGNFVTQSEVNYLQPLKQYDSYSTFLDECIKYTEKLVP